MIFIYNWVIGGKMSLSSKTAKQKKQEATEYEKTLPRFNKKKIVDLLSGVVELPKEKVEEVLEALSDLLCELTFTECVIQIPKFGKFICKPQHNQRVFNPKEGRTFIYQNPKVTFKLSSRLRGLLRKQYRRNCYQLSELNNMKIEDFKPPQTKAENEKT